MSGIRTTLRLFFVGTMAAYVSMASAAPRMDGVAAGINSPQPGDTFRDCENATMTPASEMPPGIFCGPKMVVVPAGSFDMGGLKDGDAGEQSVHRVTIPAPFAIGIFEVTQDEWQRVMGSNPSRFKGNRRPVENVNWDDVQEFLRRLSHKTGIDYRLPSESEWEYAARAGSRTDYPWGDTIQPSEAKYGSPDGTVDVGSYEANAFGLYDTVGNVWEWTQDCWQMGYFGAPDDGTPRTSGYFDTRVYRGGGWDDAAPLIRSAVRGWDYPDFKDDGLGFRVARSLVPRNRSGN